jgi:hypothetical protein
MARYGAPTVKATGSTTVGAASIQAPAASMRRVKVYDVIFGSQSTPGDIAMLFRFIRSTTAHTGSAVTPRPLDPADAAAVTVVNENITVEGTIANVLMEVPQNQRATVRWVANPGSELVIPATANNGILVQTPVLAGGTPAINISFLFEEQ